MIGLHDRERSTPSAAARRRKRGDVHFVRGKNRGESGKKPRLIGVPANQRVPRRPKRRGVTVDFQHLDDPSAQRRAREIDFTFG